MFQLTPTPLTRSLVRVLLALCTVSWLLSASAFGPGAAAPCQAATAGIPHRPIFCDLMTGVVLDLLNDRESRNPDLKANVGEIGPGAAAKFFVYALTDDPRFYANVTTETRATSFRIRAPRDGGSVAGTMRYSIEGNMPVYVFTPDRETREDRIAFIDVAYHCRWPSQTYTATFMLTIRGTDRSAPDAAALPVTLPARSRPRVKPDPAGCADVAITLEPTSGLLLKDTEQDVTIAVTNLGPDPLASAVARIVFSNRLGVQTWYSPDDTGLAVREVERTLRYDTGPLAPGATAHLIVTVLGQSAGAAPITADNGAVDCNPANDHAEGELTVSLPPVPDLTGQWNQLSVVPPASGDRPRRQHVEGLLTVRNDNWEDGGASRVVVFLSKDTVPSPDDRLLGFGDVPALPARTETIQALSFDLRTSEQTRGRYVLAVVDSSNYDYESSEKNNLVVSQRLP